MNYHSGIFLTAMLAVATASQATEAQVERRSFDVAMNGHSFSFEGDTNAGGFPADGTPFVIRGYIYPGGTFERHGEGSGVLPDGSPEFPDRVLGIWYCRGWHLQDGDALTGPVVATTQIFSFKGGWAGGRTLITDGIELADFGVPFERAVTGGTIEYTRRVTRVMQIYVAFNATNSFNTSFELKLRR